MPDPFGVLPTNKPVNDNSTRTLFVFGGSLTNRDKNLLLKAAVWAWAPVLAESHAARAEAAQRLWIGSECFSFRSQSVPPF